MSLRPLPWPSAELTDTRVVVPATRSRRKTSGLPLVSPVTRLAPPETNATYLPSSDISDWELTPKVWVSFDFTDTRVVVEPKSPAAAAPATGPTASATTTDAPSAHRFLWFIAAPLLLCTPDHRPAPGAGQTAPGGASLSSPYGSGDRAPRRNPGRPPVRPWAYRRCVTCAA